MAKLRSEIKDLKQFGSALTGILMVFGVVNFLKGRASWYPWFFSLSGAMILLVLIAPRRIKPIFIIFTKVAHAIGWVNTRVILALIYFIFVTPIAIVMRIFGKDPLDRSIDKNEMSYWAKREAAKPAKEKLEKQF